MSNLQVIMKEILKNKYSLIGLYAVLFVIVSGMSYAFFATTSLGNENAKEVSVSNTTLKLKYADTLEIQGSNIEPNWSITKTISVENIGTGEVYYSLIFQNLINEIERNEMVIRATCTSNKGTCDDIEETAIKYSTESTSFEIMNGIYIESGEKQTYQVTIEFKEMGVIQNYNQHKIFTAVLGVKESKLLIKTIASQSQGLDSVRSTYVTSDSGIDFTLAGGTTNGQGIYTRSGTENEDYPIYYYRGAVENNNVIFGSDGTNKFCWKIVRTNDNGSIRMIYSGIAYKDANDVYTCTSDGTTALTNTDVFMNVYRSSAAIDDNYAYSYTNGGVYQSLRKTIEYNMKSDDEKYIGYMYESTNENDTDSNMKRALEAWYDGALSAEDKLKIDTSAVYWNDREEMTTEEKTAYSLNTSYTYYKGVLREKIGSPSLSCEINRDCFTATNREHIGNEKLTYPIGLITIDEVMLAGRGFRTGMEDYLFADVNIWLFTPHSFDNSLSYIFYLNRSNCINTYNKVDLVQGIRGIISILGNTTYSLQDEHSYAGTITNPYVIE